MSMFAHSAGYTQTCMFPPFHERITLVTNSNYGLNMFLFLDVHRRTEDHALVTANILPWAVTKLRWENVPRAATAAGVTRVAGTGTRAGVGTGGEGRAAIGRTDISGMSRGDSAFERSGGAVSQSRQWQWQQEEQEVQPEQQERSSCKKELRALQAWTHFLPTTPTSKSKL
jgi:hypothetical protein